MPPSSRDTRESPARRQRQRRTHQRTDSNGDLIPPRSRRERDGSEDYASPSSPSKRRPKRREDYERDRRRSHRAPESEYSRSTGTGALSSGQLAQLDKLNRKLGWNEYDVAQRPGLREDDEQTRAEYDDDREREREEARERKRQAHREQRRRRREEERLAAGGVASVDDDGYVYERPTKHGRQDRRVISGQRLERGARGGGGGSGGGSDGYYSEKETYRDRAYRKDGGSSDIEFEESERKRKRKRNIWIGVGVIILILVIAIPVGIVVSKKSSGQGGDGGDSSDTSSSKPSNSNLDGIKESDIPEAYQGTSFDPFTWYDTTDLNVTFTSELVGGLPIMGLNSSWDDSAQANDNVKALNKTWTYGTDLVRGVNIGGWLSLEPVITPSLFSGYSSSDSVVDEYTLSQKLGSSAKATIEKHYSEFVTEETFKNISAAGFDHVRIPYSYWAVIIYDGDPYVPNVSFRYLLRGIEWARKYGLRVNLDLHGAPGSQNGWNHSGRQGTIGWLNGTDGDLNANRTIEIHKQLSTFFTQPRYKNIITMYGLLNEPRMVELDQSSVVSWTESAISAIRANNYTGILIFGDGFMGLDNWQGVMQDIPDLLLDVHQYVIFNTGQIIFDHYDKISYACGGWTEQAKRSMDTSTGFGPTLCGEWSQADTDCATYLNNVGVGSRWEGTLNMVDTPGGSASGSVLDPTCPTNNDPRCDCDPTNADPSTYSDEYKKWLLMFAEAQMYSFEQGWGWFYWTWQTETSTQWSYKDGLAAGILPTLAYKRDWECGGTIPMFNTSGLPEYY